MSDITNAQASTASSTVPTSIAEKKNYISVTKGMAYFAVEYWWNPGGFWEPWTTSYGRYRTKAEAEVEAKEWAEEDGLEYIPNDSLV